MRSTRFDRMNNLAMADFQPFAAVGKSGCGTFRTSSDVRSMVAQGNSGH
jgi:hypothetical protein